MLQNKTKSEPTAQKIVDYWPEQKPFVGRGPYPAKVCEVLKDGACMLVVDNPNTGRSFNATAKASDKPTSGCFTERAAEAAPSVPAKSGSVTVKTSVAGE